jgi:hypothetical protein
LRTVPVTSTNSWIFWASAPNMLFMAEIQEVILRDFWAQGTQVAKVCRDLP